MKALDIGSKNFSYAPAIFSWIQKRTQNFSSTYRIDLTGIEVDANRLYSNLYNRIECSKYYSSLVPSARMLAGDFLDHETGGGKFGLVTLFYPFVSEYPLLQWGLPLRKFRPEAMFEKISLLLDDGGTLVVSNMNKEEFSILEKLAGRFLKMKGSEKLNRILSGKGEVFTSWFGK
jgi:hypothetical protein